jgi:hypothetical protein
MKTGIYFLLRSGCVVYIGQTARYPKRILGHNKKEYDAVRFIECCENLLTSYEQRWINRFKPEYNLNKAGNSRPRRDFEIFNLRIKKSVLNSLRVRASKENRAMNTIAQTILEEALSFELKRLKA